MDRVPRDNAKAKTAAGLQALGAVPFRWSPWSDMLTFHSVRILRDGQSIDVLPKDGGFTVLRRETGLEQAILTGELIAVLEIAVSIRHADPLLKGHSSAFLSNWDLIPVGYVRLEARWPSSLPVRWRETAGLPPLRRSQANGATVMTLEMDDVLPPVLPSHAPLRYQHGRELEFTTFAGWDQVASIVAPLMAAGWWKPALAAPPTHTRTPPSHSRHNRICGSGLLGWVCTGRGC